MMQTIWDTSGDVDRRWTKRKAPSMGVPSWAGLAIVGLGLVLIGTLAWQGGRYVWRRLRGETVANAAIFPGGSARTGPASDARNRPPEWQIEAQGAFQSGATAASTGNIDAAEIDVDHGAEILSQARARQLMPPPDFFDTEIRTLDKVVQTHPDNDRLIEHTVLARIELAQLRTMSPSPRKPEGRDAGAAVSFAAAGESPTENPSGKTADKAPDQAIRVYSPISIAANSTFDPAKAHGNLLDATMMADDAEVLLPPASRLFADGVHVRNVSVHGASQTLDGFYWENVTFVGTRLRYDGGEVSLHNVRFVNCTFGVQPDERGARLATAIALGQNSIVVE